jgi:serine/threonine protein kinase
LDGHVQLQEVARETLLCFKLRHRNIVELKGVCVSPPDVSLVFELCELGDLRAILNEIVQRRRARTSDAVAALAGVCDDFDGVAWVWLPCSVGGWREQFRLGYVSRLNFAAELLVPCCP